MVKNLPSNAGDVGSIPGQGTKIPHAAGQLSPCTATTEPTRFGAHAPQLERSRVPQRRAHARQQKIPLAAMKIPRAATKTRRSQINK